MKPILMLPLAIILIAILWAEFIILSPILFFGYKKLNAYAFFNWINQPLNACGFKVRW